MPIRIQRKRSKGWRMPDGAIAVTRGTIWGNPFSVRPDIKPGTRVGGAHGYIAVPTAADAVACFREMMASQGETADALRSRLPELRGHDLACWCKPGDPCHADVLIELANN
jgi:hypothetical protein